MSMCSNLYQQLIDNQTTAIILLNKSLHLEYMNNAAETLLATSSSRTQGQPAKDLFIDFDSGFEEMKAALASGQPYTKRESQLQLSHNAPLTVDYTVTPIYDGLESYLITEIFPRDRWLRISREENLKWQHEASQTLIRGFAHEIKNPLGGIRGAAQLLARELPDNALEDYTNVIIEEADRLRHLVDQMLGPYRPIELGPLNIHAVLERIRSLIESESNGKVEVIRDYDPSIPEVQGNQERLIQAFLNIARNAMQAFSNSSENQACKITLVTRTIRQLTLANIRYKIVCRVDIIDNGPGISQELQEKIFYPMVSGRAEGTGLGLTIAQHIIDQHQGLIEFQSNPGNTCFTVFIPLEINNKTGNESEMEIK